MWTTFQAVVEAVMPTAQLQFLECARALADSKWAGINWKFVRRSDNKLERNSKKALSLIGHKKGPQWHITHECIT